MKNKLFKFIIASITFLISILFLRVFLDNNIMPTGYGKEFLIGMSQCNQAEPYRAQMNADIQQAALEYDNIKVVFTDAIQDNNKQIQDINNLMAMGLDLLIVSPNESEPLTNIITEVSETIPVIVLDRKVNTESYTLFIGSDNYLIGKKAGDFVVNTFGNETINILEISGLLGSAPTIDRSKGFTDAIADSTNIKIVETFTANWLRDDSEDKMTFFLENSDFRDKINIIYSHNDPMAFGAYKALNNLEMSVDFIIGIDGLTGETGGIELVNKGIIDLTFSYPTGGKEAIEYAMRILNNEDIKVKNIILEAEMIR